MRTLRNSIAIALFLFLGHIIPGYPQSVPKGYLNVKAYGATGSGKVDDQNAINQAIIAAEAQKAGLFFPTGRYLHSSTIVAKNVSFMGTGASSILIATNPTSGALDLSGTFSASNFSLKYEQPAKLMPMDPSTAYSDPNLSASNMVVTGANIKIKGVKFSSSSDWDLVVAPNSDGVTVADCDSGSGFPGGGAGGVAILGSQNIHLHNNSITHGAGLVALDTSSLKFANNNLGPGSWITISGTTNSQISDNTITAESGFAGIITLVVASVNKGNGPISNIQINGNSITAKRPTQSVVIMALNAAMPPNPVGLENITIAGNTFHNVDCGISVVGPNSNMSITNNTFSNIGAVPGWGLLMNPITFASGVNTNIANNKITGTYYSGIYCSGSQSTSASIKITNNTFSNCYLEPTSKPNTSAAAIVLTSGNYQSVVISDNTYKPPVGGVQYFIDCLAPSNCVKASGNITPGLTLPSYFAP